MTSPSKEDSPFWYSACIEKEPVCTHAVKSKDGELRAAYGLEIYNRLKAAGAEIPPHFAKYAETVPPLRDDE